MAISANSVFHFTDSLDDLISILENEFCPRYSLEEFLYPEVKLAIPMVCFCDIPLSQTKNHINTYGPYGLGMSKNWAKEKGLNPVLYLRDDSILHKNLASIFRSTTQDLAKDALSKLLEDRIKNPTEEPAWTTSLNILRYVKLYKGALFKAQLKENIPFYEEREWRYVPNFITRSSEIQPSPFLTEIDFQDKQKKEKEEKILENYKLSFNPDNIKYVIIKNEDEIHKIIKNIRVVKGKYPPEIVDILCSKIITSENIEKDF